MSYLNALSDAAIHALRTRLVSEYATISAAGAPIDTPTYFFPRADLSTIDVATGLAYPAKADRARRNPKVGLLIEGGPNDPIISISGMAAVRDANLQANMDRYLRETIVTPVVSPETNNWADVRNAVHYLTRIIVEVTPAHVRWWPNRVALEHAPAEWRAPAGAIFPQSDPSPSGKVSSAPSWPQPTWQELAEQSAAAGFAAYLTLIDADGFPLPFRAKEISRSKDGFKISMPAAIPWREGKASLSYIGRAVFVGDVRFEDGMHVMKVERALPVLPFMDDGNEVILPSAATRATMMARLEHEAARRGQKIPVVSDTPPKPTEFALLRAAGAADWQTKEDDA